MTRDEVIGYTARIEKLMRGLGYEGDGLGQLAKDAKNAKNALSKEVLSAIFRVNKIRNHAVHEENWAEDLGEKDFAGFKKDAEFVLMELQKLPKGAAKSVLAERGFSQGGSSQASVSAARGARPSQRVEGNSPTLLTVAKGVGLVVAAGLYAYFLNK